MKLAIDGGKPLLEKYDFSVRAQDDEIVFMVDALKKGHLTSFEGKNSVEQFEKEFAAYHKCRFAVAANTGTASIHSAIAAMNAKEGGEVIVPAYTFITGVSPMLIEGLRPVFADVSIKDIGMDVGFTKALINENTVGLLPAHLFGFPCEIKQLQKIAADKGLFLIEDCCQAHGADVDGQKVGTFGDIGCFSFYLFKNMTTGEGGMSTTNNPELYKNLRTMRQCGKENPDSKDYVRLGFNYRMPDVCAAMGIPQLRKLDENNNKRRVLARIYQKRLKKIGFEIFPEREGTTPVYFKFPVLLPEDIAKKRDYLVAALKAENVNMPLFNSVPLNKVEFFKKIAVKENYAQRFYEENFPNTEEIERRLIAFFTHSLFSEERINGICDAVEKVVKNVNW